jgi:kanamycin nucleotidyltransferase
MGPGLRHHSHEERSRIVDALVPLVKRHMGKNLLALAATGSFARGTDGGYSDVELIGIVRKPVGDRASVKFIYDGMLIDMWFLTVREYLDDHRLKVRPTWPYTVSSVLVPLYNDPLINEIHRTGYNTSIEDRIAALRKIWPEFQESSAKVLTAVERGQGIVISHLFWQMAEKMCAILSLLNGKPFSTRAAVFTEVRDFDRLPKDFRTLLTSRVTESGAEEIARTTIALFEGLERLLVEADIELYASSLGSFVQVETVGMKMRRSPSVGRFARKAHKAGQKIRRILRPAG